jgi:hypothetical protein
VSLKAMTAVPGRRSARVWPAPQNAPSRHERTMLRCWLTRVETAARWSASSAWRRPSKSPSPSAESSGVSIVGLPVGSEPEPKDPGGDEGLGGDDYA